jgi:hypothetical protein
VGGLSTPKGGDPSQLEKGEEAYGAALLNNAEKPRPDQVAPQSGQANPRDQKSMRNTYTERTHGVDPVHGRSFVGTSHLTPAQLHSRPIGRGRQTVYESFGPFKDSTSRKQTYMYIYNDPVIPKPKK